MERESLTLAAAATRVKNRERCYAAAERRCRRKPRVRARGVATQTYLSRGVAMLYWSLTRRRSSAAHMGASLFSVGLHPRLPTTSGLRPSLIPKQWPGNIAKRCSYKDLCMPENEDIVRGLRLITTLCPSAQSSVSTMPWGQFSQRTIGSYLS